MFMRLRPSLFVPRGIMAPNIRSTKLLTTGAFSGRRRMFSPQKVKNMVTRRPIAAAPFAMMKAAMVLSKSLENTTKVLSSCTVAGG